MEVKVQEKDSLGKHSDNRTVKELVDLYDQAYAYTNANYRTRWDKCWKVYNRQRVDRHYDGIADPVIPETYTIVESLVANIAGGNPSVDYVPTNEEQSREVAVLNGMFDYVMACNNMGIRQQQWVREDVMYGTAVLHVGQGENYPVIDNIALRDFFVDPSARNEKEASYMGHRYLIDKDKLKEAQIYDAQEDKYVPRYKSLDKIGERSDSQGDAGTDKEYKEMFSGSTFGNMADEKQVEIIRIYDTKNARLIEVANRTEIIFNEPTPYQRDEQEIEVDVEVPSEDPSIPPQIKKVKKKLAKINPFAPYAILRGIQDPSLFYGTGDVEVIVDLQERLNDWEAIDMDVAAITAMPMFWVDPQFRDVAGEIEVIPGAVYPIPRNAIGQIDRPVLGVDIQAKKYEIQEQMRRATAADEVIQGSSQQQGRVTATEVQSQLNQASQRFSTKITNLEDGGYADLASIIHKFFQLFITTAQAVRVVGPEGVAFKDYDPFEFDGEYQPHVKLETTIRQQKLEEGQKLNQIYQMIMNNPVVDQRAGTRWMFKKMDAEISRKELDELIMPPQPPQEDVKDMAIMNYKDATPFTKAQMEMKAGYQPDPIHEIEEKTLTAQMAAQQVMHGDPTTDVQGKPIPPQEAPGMSEGTEPTGMPPEGPEGATEPAMAPQDPSMGAPLPPAPGGDMMAV